jgi:hypothetical protein
MIIDLDEYRNKKKPKPAKPLGTDWTIGGWDIIPTASFSFIDPKSGKSGVTIEITSTITKRIDFFFLLDPRGEVVAGFPSEYECWEHASEKIGIKSPTVMKKLGWMVILTSVEV